MSARQKAVTLSLLWISLGATMIWTVEAAWLRVLLTLIGLGVTLHVARLPVMPVSQAFETRSES